METSKKSRPGRKMFTTTISLTYQDHKKLKHLAVDRGLAVRDLIREAVEKYLHRRQKHNRFSDPASPTVRIS